MNAATYYALADVKGGCLHGGHLGKFGGPNLNMNMNGRSRTARGVQVFTYRELETATGQFSERNVIGNGGFGVVYRGVLGDGTVAAIRMLHLEGKQGERAFRVEVKFLQKFK